MVRVVVRVFWGDLCRYDDLEQNITCYPKPNPNEKHHCNITCLLPQVEVPVADREHDVLVEGRPLQRVARAEVVVGDPLHKPAGRGSLHRYLYSAEWGWLVVWCSSRVRRWGEKVINQNVRRRLWYLTRDA